MNKVFPLEFAKFYSACLITVLDYLHKKRIIHRNIRAENVLINSNGYIKLSEFTFSKLLTNDMTYSICGSPEYYSPEMINKSGHNKSIDFWQLGILLYEMLVGNLPFIDSDTMILYNKINKGKIHFPKNINENAKSIIRHFLNVDINKRLGCGKRGIYEIIKHPFFKNFDWEGLLHRRLDPPFIPRIDKLNINKNYKKI
jgi:protein kinase A